MKFLDKLQSLLPLGYLYLILLGLIKESILFNKIGINILKYSSITDILISPIADITSKLSILIAVVSFILILLFIAIVMINYSNKRWVQKVVAKKGQEGQLSKADITQKIYKIFLVMIAFELFSLFIGLGVGQGNRLAQTIKSNKIEYNYEMNFGNNEKEEIYLIDLNSAYYFYLTKGDKRIKIAPAGSIKNLTIIHNHKLN